MFDPCDPLGVQLLTRLRVSLNHLREHKFRHGFNDVVNPFCPCNNEIESVSHYYLRCHNNSIQRLDLMNELSNLDPRILQLDSNSLTSLLLYGSKLFTDNMNSKIIALSIEFIKKTKRFEGSLF